jgi:hypothetical protein
VKNFHGFDSLLPQQDFYSLASAHLAISSMIFTAKCRDQGAGSTNQSKKAAITNRNSACYWRLNHCFTTLLAIKYLLCYFKNDLPVYNSINNLFN